MLVSGMIVDPAFTLFVVPSIYVLVARTRVPIPSAAATGEERKDALPDLAELPA